MRSKWLILVISFLILSGCSTKHTVDFQTSSSEWEIQPKPDVHFSAKGDSVCTSPEDMQELITRYQKLYKKAQNHGAFVKGEDSNES